jgi:ABC-2 type transport system permease protein
LIAVTMMIIAAMLSSMTIAREWENGTMEQLLSTPVRPRELVLGKLLAYFALGIIDMVICIIVGVFIFQVPFRGSVWFLFFTSCLFLFGALSWGIFLSAAARSQLLAYQLGMLSSFLPGYLLSGFIYSIQNMPKVIQLITFIVPARYFVKILNGVFLKGVGFRFLWFEILMLSTYAALVFLAASRKMKQKVA